jgi:hypothetical protein
MLYSPSPGNVNLCKFTIFVVNKILIYNELTPIYLVAARELFYFVHTSFFQLIGHKRNFLGLGSPWGSTPDPSQWNKDAPLTIVAFFFRICNTNEKLDLFMQTITDIFSLWQAW